MSRQVSDFAERQHFLTPVERGRQTERLVREQRRQAVLRVCHDARDATDAAFLLDVLGLDPREGQLEPSSDVSVAAPVGAIRATTSWNDPGRIDAKRSKS